MPPDKVVSSENRKRRRRRKRKEKKRANVLTMRSCIVQYHRAQSMEIVAVLHDEVVDGFSQIS